MSNFDYQGPSDVYIAPIDNARRLQPRTRGVMSSGGYHDMDQLQKNLKLIKDTSTWMFDYCSKELQKFSIKVDTTNTELKAAHDRVYPSDTTPGYITFDEYKYLLTATDSREVQYVKKYYETEMRGPSGTIALDFLIISKAVHAEVERIKTFITDYIGDVDETAEFRTMELFQDWTQTASTLLSQLKKGVQTPVTKSIPKPEVGKLTPELSSNFQALLQSKLNILNKYITDFMQLFETNWNGPSNDFYTKKLGPSLKFQIKVGKTLTDPDAISPKRYPTLVSEVSGTIKGLATEFSVALTDQLKRNQAFDTYVTGVINNFQQRDTYKNYIQQLTQHGKPVVNNFVNATAVEQAEVVLKALDPLTNPTRSLSSSTSILPSHRDLVDADASDAHPQYLLRDKGEITGPISLTTGALIDGMRPATHRHTGQDGTSKIRGRDIEVGSVTDDVIDPNSTTPIPTNLKVASMDDSQSARVKVEITLTVPKTDGIVNYEFQVTKLGGGQ